VSTKSGAKLDEFSTINSPAQIDTAFEIIPGPIPNIVAKRRCSEALFTLISYIVSHHYIYGIDRFPSETHYYNIQSTVIGTAYSFFHIYDSFPFIQSDLCSILCTSNVIIRIYSLVFRENYSRLFGIFKVKYFLT
jgi:hypothetical protein